MNAIDKADGFFETIGAFFQQGLLTFTKAASDSIVIHVLPIVGVGLTLFFIVRGYLILMGKSDGAFQDLLLTMGKMAIVFGIALSAGQYNHYMIRGFDSLSSGLTQAIAGAISNNTATYSNPWGAIDTLWKTYFENAGHALTTTGKMKSGGFFNTIGDAIITVLGLLAFITIAIQCIILSSICIGILFIAEFTSKFLLALGPLFFTLYLFPLTKDFFQSWLKSLLTPLFMMVLIVTALALIATLVPQMFNEVAPSIRNAKDQSPLDIVITAAIMSLFTLGMFLVIKQIPSLASGLSGGANIQGSGLGEIAKNMATGGAAAIGGVQTMRAIGAMARGDTKAATNLKRSARNFGHMASKATGSEIFGSMAGAAMHPLAIAKSKMGKSEKANLQNMTNAK